MVFPEIPPKCKLSTFWLRQSHNNYINEVASASNQLAKHEETNLFAIPYQNATTIRVSSNEKPVHNIQGPVPMLNIKD